MCQQLGEYFSLPEKALFAAFGSLLALVNAALHHFDIRHDQFQVDDVNVPQRVGGTLHVGDIGVLKAADHMNDSISGADVAKEFVAQAFALGRTLHKAGNVNEFNDGRSDLLGVVQLCQPVQTLIGNRNHTNVGVDGAECIVVSGYACIGDCIKQGRFAHVGQSDDT